MADPQTTSPQTAVERFLKHPEGPSLLVLQGPEGSGGGGLLKTIARRLNEDPQSNDLTLVPLNLDNFPGHPERLLESYEPLLEQRPVIRQLFEPLLQEAVKTLAGKAFFKLLLDLPLALASQADQLLASRDVQLNRMPPMERLLRLLKELTGEQRLVLHLRRPHQYHGPFRRQFTLGAEKIENLQMVWSLGERDSPQDLLPIHLLKRGHSQASLQGNPAQPLTPSSTAAEIERPILHFLEEDQGDLPIPQDVVRRLLRWFALCGSWVPGDLLVERLAQDDETLEDALSDLLDGALTEHPELQIFGEATFHHQDFPRIAMYPWLRSNPIFTFLQDFPAEEKAQAAHALILYLQPRLPPSRGSAELFLRLVRHHKPHEEPRGLLKKLDWWVRPEETEDLTQYLIQQVAEGKVDKEQLWHFAAPDHQEDPEAQRHFAPHQCLAFLEAYEATDGENGEETALPEGRRGKMLLHRLKLHLSLGHFETTVGLAQEAAKEWPHGSFEARQAAYFEGSALEKLARFPESKSRLEEAAEGPEQDSLSAAARAKLGDSLLAQGNPVEAKQNIEQALTIFEKLAGEEPSRDVAATLEKLARVLHAQGDPNSAREKLERALKIYAAAPPADRDPYVASAHCTLGDVLLAQGELAPAEKHFRRGLELFMQVFGGEQHPLVAAVHHSLARTLLASGDPMSAFHHLEKALQIEHQVFGTETHPVVANTLTELGMVFMHLGDLTKARQHLEKALTIFNETLPNDRHPKVAQTLWLLGEVFKHQGDVPAARQKLERGWNILAEVFGPQHPETLRCQQALDALPS